MAAGEKRAAIAARLGIGRRTVERYLDRARAKLAAQSTAHAVRLGMAQITDMTKQK